MKCDASVPRVLQLDSGRELRGGQRQLLHLVRGWPGETAVALPRDAPLFEPLSEAGVQTIPLSFRDPRDRWRLRRLVRALRPDLVAAQTSRAHALALGCGRPVVVHRRLDFVPGWLSRPKYRAPLGYVAVSQAVREVLIGIGVAAERIEVVLDGVDPRPLDAARPDPQGLRAGLGWPMESRVVLAAGALVPHKGHLDLIEAMARVPGPLRLVICGEGPLRRALEARIARRALQDRVALLGYRADLPDLLRSVDALVHPSREEGMGQVVAEAMIAGVPVIATAAGGLVEVVGRAGRLVPPGAVQELARALQELAHDPEGARRRAREARDPVRARHDPGRMVDSTLAAYRRLLARQ